MIEDRSDDENSVLPPLRDDDTSYELKNQTLTKSQIRDLKNVLASNLKNHATLTKLTLEGIGLDYKGAGIIADALVSNKKLQYLSLANNPNIGYKGVQHFGISLRLNKTLKTLNLSETGLDRDCVESLSLGLKENTALTMLNLNSNKELNYNDHETNVFINRINIRLKQSIGIQERAKKNEQKQQNTTNTSKRVAVKEESEPDSDSSVSDVKDGNWCCC